jgi:hypothetical protein
MPGIEQVKWDLGYKFIRVNFSKPMWWGSIIIHTTWTTS